MFMNQNNNTMQTEIFYNTIKATGQELADLKTKAKSQKDFIKGLYNLKTSWTRAEIETYCNKANYPIKDTSIGRVLTNLKKEGFLYKGERRKGNWSVNVTEYIKL